MTEEKRYDLAAARMVKNLNEAVRIQREYEAAIASVTRLREKRDAAVVKCLWESGLSGYRVASELGIAESTVSRIMAWASDQLVTGAGE